MVGRRKFPDPKRPNYPGRNSSVRRLARRSSWAGSLILCEIVERYNSLVDGKMMAQRNNLPLKYEPPAERGDEEIRQCNAEFSQRAVL